MVEQRVAGTRVAAAGRFCCAGSGHVCYDLAVRCPVRLVPPTARCRRSAASSALPIGTGNSRPDVTRTKTHTLQRQPISPLLLAAILAGLAMLGPFSIDTFLPSFPAIGRDLAATPAQLQQTLSAYFLPFAVMTLFHGTLSDSFGRRPVILVCLAVYVAASIGCAAAHDFAQLLLFRVRSEERRVGKECRL